MKENMRENMREKIEKGELQFVSFTGKEAPTSNIYDNETCPACGSMDIKKEDNLYICFNCDKDWDVKNQD